MRFISFLSNSEHNSVNGIQTHFLLVPSLYKDNGVVWYHGISTIFGYLMSNPFIFILTVLF